MESMPSETKNTSTGSAQVCQNCRQPFVIEPDDFAFYERIDVPAPTFCPECRMQRRFAWRNERTLHRNTCVATGKSIISSFSPESRMTVYDRDYWWSDAWDPLRYGQSYDFSRPFFVQFSELLHRVPTPAVFNTNTVNSEFTSYTGEMKDAYLVSASWGGENLAYCSRVHFCRDSMDLFACAYNELCYECVGASKSTRTFHSQACEGCVDSWFLYECRGCVSCTGCVNLRNKSYCLWNEQFTKEEYARRVAELRIDTAAGFESARRRFEDLKMKSVRKFANITNCERVTGDNIQNSADLTACFDVSSETRQCKYVQNGAAKMTDSYDGYGLGATCELVYEAIDTGVQGSCECFAATVYGCTNAFYSVNCHSCNNIFACVGLRNKEYCILNREYPKEEFESLRLRIVAHMASMPYQDRGGRVYRFGEFFPIELSPFAYNETVAQDSFPLTADEAAKRGYTWREADVAAHQPTVAVGALPETASSAPAGFENEILTCEGCSRAYRLIPKELEFLRRFGLPLPKRCPECRHLARLALRNPLKLWHRECMCDKANHSHGAGKCPVEFETSYSPDRKEIVYCEGCYNAEVV
jgi:hypothetical protein